MATVVQEPKDTRWEDLSKGFEQFGKAFVDSYRIKEEENLVKELTQIKHKNEQKLMSMDNMNKITQLAMQHGFDLQEVGTKIEGESRLLAEKAGFDKEQAKLAGSIARNNALAELAVAGQNDRTLALWKHRYGLGELREEGKIKGRLQEDQQKFLREEGAQDRTSAETVAGIKAAAREARYADTRDKKILTFTKIVNDAIDDSGSYTESEKRAIVRTLNTTALQLGLDDYAEFEVKNDGSIFNPFTWGKDTSEIGVGGRLGEDTEEDDDEDSFERIY